MLMYQRGVPSRWHHRRQVIPLPFVWDAMWSLPHIPLQDHLFHEQCVQRAHLAPLLCFYSENEERKRKRRKRTRKEEEGKKGRKWKEEEEEEEEGEKEKEKGEFTVGVVRIVDESSLISSFLCINIRFVIQFEFVSACIL